MTANWTSNRNPLVLTLNRKYFHSLYNGVCAQWRWTISHTLYTCLSPRLWSSGLPYDLNSNNCTVLYTLHVQYTITIHYTPSWRMETFHNYLVPISSTVFQKMKITQQSYHTWWFNWWPGIYSTSWVTDKQFLVVPTAHTVTTLHTDSVTHFDIQNAVISAGAVLSFLVKEVWSVSLSVWTNFLFHFISVRQRKFLL